MRAYWIVRCHVVDVDEFKKYMNLSGPIIDEYGGTFLARGGNQKEYELIGYERTVLIEFKNIESATACYKSKKYQNALQYVHNSAKRSVVIVEGVN
jgi:uncharacterized protein (DUF1330 family)|tara:strand:+ start:6126 stop:6413 length:288 start_codon:yes stop_codon:yes gene_type:complete